MAADNRMAQRKRPVVAHNLPLHRPSLASAHTDILETSRQVELLARECLRLAQHHYRLVLASDPCNDLSTPTGHVGEKEYALGNSDSLGGPSVFDFSRSKGLKSFWKSTPVVDNFLDPKYPDGDADRGD